MSNLWEGCQHEDAHATTCMLVGTCIIDVLWTDKPWTFESILCRCLQSEGYTRIHLPGPHCKFMHEFWALFCTCKPLTYIGADRLWLCPTLYGGCCDCATRPVSGCSCHSKPHFWEVLHGSYSLLCGPLFHSKLPSPTPWCLLPSPNLAGHYGFVV